MRYNRALHITILVLFLFSCKKNHTSPVPPLGSPPKILLKDLILPGLPSPYYHFEYNTDSLVTKAEFDSGLTSYDVLYNGGKISEMRNNIIVNHDTLRYIYDNAGKVAIIVFINDANVTYRHVLFSYDGNLVKEIIWDHKEGNVGFLIDRTLTFTYYPDGNVKTVFERRPATTGVPETTSAWEYSQYDNGINVDDFDLTHDGIHDHLFLFQGFRLQKNNPKKETFTGGTIGYSVDYTYTYNSDHTPSLKAGTLVYTAGPDAGKTFQVSAIYSYY